MTFSQPSFSPFCFQTVVSKARASFDRTKPDGRVDHALGDLDDDGLDGLR